nr:proteoglycan 4-like [Drosophila takahashii]
MPSTQVEAPKPQQPEMPPPQVESPKPQQPETLPPPQPEPPRSNPGEHHVRTDIPAAHVSHSARAFVIDGVRWRQQTITWTWPEGPAEDATAGEEPQIWEEVEPRVSPRDPRVRGRPEATATQNPGSTTPAPATPDSWKPPTPSTGPATPASPYSGAAADNATRLAGQRPPWKRQHSAPEVVGEAARPKLMRQTSAPEGQRWREIEKDEWPEGIADVQAVKEARILGGRRSVRVRLDGRGFRVRIGLAGLRVFEEQRP